MAKARAKRKRSQSRNRMSFGQRLALLLVFVLLFVPSFVFAALQGWIPASVVNAVARVFIWRQEEAVAWTADQPVNVLILGVQGSSASSNPLTDSIMVASYQPQTGSVSLLSIPRDLWVDIPGYGQARINEAFETTGPYGAMLTVQKNLGIPVNYYAIINYKAVERLIDDVGGVTVEVPYDIDDPTFPADDGVNYDPFSITAGVHHLDGREALRYARTRHADSDFGRAQRQQQVILALKDQLLKPWNWLKAPVLLRDVRNLVVTNFPMDQAPGLVLQILHTGSDSIQRAVLSYENGAVSPYTGAGGASLLLLNEPVAGEIVEEFFGPSLTYLRNAPSVQVANGNGYAGAATQFSQVLEGMGASVLEPADADRTDYQTHKVYYSRNDRATVRAARLIAGMLGTTAERSDTATGAAIEVILGRNYAPYTEFTTQDWQRYLPSN